MGGGLVSLWHCVVSLRRPRLASAPSFTCAFSQCVTLLSPLVGYGVLLTTAAGAVKLISFALFHIVFTPSLVPGALLHFFGLGGSARLFYP